MLLVALALAFFITFIYLCIFASAVENGLVDLNRFSHSHTFFHANMHEQTVKSWISSL